MLTQNKKKIRLTSRYPASSELRARVARCAALLLTALAATPSYATSMSDVAAALQPGEWAELDTNNFDAATLDDGAGYDVFYYTEDLTWDPVSRQLLFVGGGHGTDAEFLRYSEASNTWARTKPTGGFWHGNFSHAYDHNAIIPSLGKFYFRQPAFDPSDRIEIYDIASGSWSRSAPMPYRPGCCGGLEYFPELNGLVLANGDSGLLHYDPAGNRWSEISGASWGDYHNFAEYSAVHRLMIFGGGEGAGGSALFRLDANRQIARLNDAPRRMGTTHSVVTVDPVGGNFLVFFDDASYEFNPLTEVWAPLPSVPPWLSLGAPGIFNVVATPISDYGVVLVAKYAGDDSRVYLYRHRPSAPAPGLALSANPATVDAGGSSTLSWTSTNSTQCTGSGGTNAWPGSKSVPSGSESVGPIQVRTIFGLSCAGAGGAIQRFVAVDVSQPGGSTGNSSGGGGSLGLLALLSLGGALVRRGFARA